MRITALVSLLLCFATPLLAGDSFIASLPIGRIKADVMQDAPSARAAELTTKLKSAVQSNPELWQADAQQMKEGDRLAWNERLGLTRDEYAELQRLNGEGHLAKAAEAEIEFVHAADGRVMLRADATLAELSGIIIDPQNDWVDTPFGRVTEGSAVIAEEDRRVGGSWSGEQWTLDAPGETFGMGTTVKFGIGHRLDDGRGILFYEAKKVEPNQQPRHASYVIVFPLARR